MKYDPKIIDILTKNSIFYGLSPDQLAEILPCVVTRIQTFSELECVYKKGDAVRELGIVVSGKLMADGGQGAPGDILPNGMFGEVVVFSTVGNIPHRVIAREGTQVVFLSGDFFLQQCQKNCLNKDTHSEIVKNMLRLISDKAVLLNKKIAYLSAPDLKTKIAMYLSELYELSGSVQFNMPLNRDRLSDFFAVARPSLSRELIGLKNQGIIAFNRSQVKILRLDELLQLAGKIL